MQNYKDNFCYRSTAVMFCGFQCCLKKRKASDSQNVFEYMTGTRHLCRWTNTIYQLLILPGSNN